MPDQPDGQQQQRAVPIVYASAISLAATGTDIKISFEDSVPSLGGGDDVQQEKRRVALVNMSFHTAKDLLALLSGALETIEAQFGPIDTPFLQNRTRRSK